MNLLRVYAGLVSAKAPIFGLLFGLTACSSHSPQLNNNTHPNRASSFNHAQNLIIFNAKTSDPPIRISYSPLAPQKHEQKNILVLNIQILAPLTGLQIELYGDRGVRLAHEDYVENHGFLPANSQIRLNIPLSTYFIRYPKNLSKKSHLPEKAPSKQKYFVNVDIESLQKNSAQHRRYLVPIEVMP